MRRRSLSPDQPLLVGTLTVFDNGMRTPPTLEIGVWCPSCKTTHHHGWIPTRFSDEVSHRNAHCRSQNSPYLHRGYYIGLDPHPTLKAEHKEAVRRYEVMVAKVAERGALTA